MDRGAAFLLSGSGCNESGPEYGEVVGRVAVERGKRRVGLAGDFEGGDRDREEGDRDHNREVEEDPLRAAAGAVEGVALTEGRAGAALGLLEQDGDHEQDRKNDLRGAENCFHEGVPFSGGV